MSEEVVEEGSKKPGGKKGNHGQNTTDKQTNKTKRPQLRTVASAKNNNSPTSPSSAGSKTQMTTNKGQTTKIVKQITATMERIDSIFAEKFVVQDFSIIRKTKIFGAVCLAALFPTTYILLTLLVTSASIYFAYSFSYLLFLPWFVGALFYIPLVTAVTLITLFMLRPLVYGPHSYSHTSSSLLCQKQQLVDVFVHTLSKKLKSHTPVAVYASMGSRTRVYTKGIKGIKKVPYDLSLSLPMAQCLPAKQFIGLMCAELALFGNHGARRSFYFARVIEEWLEGGIQNRDGWKRTIELISTNRATRFLKPIAPVFEFGINVVNMLLDKILALYKRVCSPIFDEMARYGDMCAVEAIGKDNYATAIVKQQKIVAAANLIKFDHLDISRGLPNSFPLHVWNSFCKIPDDVVGDAKIKQRLTRVKELGTKKEIALEFTSDKIFRQFDSLCLEASAKYYREKYNLPETTEFKRSEDKNVPLPTIPEPSNLLKDYTQGWFDNHSVWIIPSAESVVNLNPQQKIKLLDQSIVALRNSIPELNDYDSEIKQLKRNILEIEHHNIFEKSGSKSYIHGLVERNERIQEKCKKTLSTYGTYFGYRVSVAVSLLDNQDLKSKTEQLLASLHRLNGLSTMFPDIEISKVLLEELIANKIYHNKDVQDSIITGLARNIHKHNQRLHTALNKLPPKLIKNAEMLKVLQKHLTTLRKSSSKKEAELVGLLDDFNRLHYLFCCFNQALSLHLAKISIHVEKEHDIKPIRLLKVVKQS